MNKITVNLNRKIGNSYEIHIRRSDSGPHGADPGEAKLGRTVRHRQPTPRSTPSTESGVQKALENADLRVERIAVAPRRGREGDRTVLVITERLTALGADRQNRPDRPGGRRQSAT